MFGGTVRVDVGVDALPPWVTEKLFIEGGFRVTTSSFSVPELTSSKIADDNLVSV